MSGTGKSYRSSALAYEKGIEHIIDDGLLIKGSKVLAGISAKKETTKVAAVKRALFMDPDQRRSVREAILREKPESILILGTSKNMVNRIIAHLELPPVTEWIHIEDIATEKEIRTAQRQRKEEGKHVIPVPTFEIRKDFSGYFIDPLKIFRSMGKGSPSVAMEKTVVRPTYSYMGKFVISDSAIESLAVYNAEGVEGIQRVMQCNIVSKAGGVDVYMDVAAYYGVKLDKALMEVQKRIAEDMDRITGIHVLHVNVTVRKIVFS